MESFFCATASLDRFMLLEQAAMEGAVKLVEDEPGEIPQHSLFYSRLLVNNREAAGPPLYSAQANRSFAVFDCSPGKEAAGSGAWMSVVHGSGDERILP